MLSFEAMGTCGNNSALVVEEWLTSLLGVPNRAVGA